MKRVLSILIIAGMLTGCSVSSEISEECNSSTEVTTISTTIVASAATTATAATTTTVVTTSATEKECVVELSEIDITALSGEFDEAEPMRYKLVDEAEISSYIDEDKLELAKTAVLNSEYYAEALEAVRGYFKYENGEIVSTTAESIWPVYYERYVAYNETEGITIELELRNVYRTAFDGINTEDIFIFGMPLPMSRLEWSGTGDFYVTVYVNSDDDAVILDMASQQSLAHPRPIIYEDSTVHMVFGKGHTQGTTWSYVYSFSDGKAYLEYETSNIELSDDGYILRENCGSMGHWYKLFFRDAKRGCYCEVSGRELSRDEVAILSHCPDITKQYPDIENHVIDIVGGRYITVGSSDSFEISNGNVIPCEGQVFIPANFASDEDKDVTCLYIDLYKWN